MKTGRPTATGAPRDRRIGLRLTEKEWQRLQDMCDKFDLTYLDVVMKGVEYFERLDKKS